MQVNRIFETVLYSDDLEAAKHFYQEILGLEIVEYTDFLLAFRCSGGVLLIFDPAQSSAPGRDVPSHGASGPGHIAFAAQQEDLEDWKTHLEQKGVEIESEIAWSSGGLSIYFRDPSGNSVELASPTRWGGGWGF